MTFFYFTINTIYLTDAHELHILGDWVVKNSNETETLYLNNRKTLTANGDGLSRFYW
jgi:hypothetical protein